MNKTYDDLWEEWKPGDLIIWEEDRGKETQYLTLHEIDTHQRVFWYEGLEEYMTRATNMVRVNLL